MSKMAGKLMKEAATITGGWKTEKTKGKRGQPRIKTIQVSVKSRFHNAHATLAGGIQNVIDRETKSGAVRIQTNVGRVANLKCPLENRRSIAAILAKKYAKYSPELARYHERAKRFVLDNTAIEIIFLALAKVKQCKYKP